MNNIGFISRNTSATAISPITLTPTTAWETVIAYNSSGAVTTAPAAPTAVQITWASSQPFITLRVVSSNIVASPSTTLASINFRVAVTATNSVPAANLFVTYNSSDFNIVVPKNNYVWFRLGPAGASRTITVFNATNNTIIDPPFTLTSGPIITPNTSIGLTRIGTSSYTYNYNLYTVQVTDLLPATPLSIDFNWDYTGTYSPKLFYIKNAAGVSTTGPTTLAALPNGTTNTPTTAGFTEITEGSSISVSLNDYLTFATFIDGAKILGNNINASGIITVPTGVTVSTINMNLIDQ